MNQMAIKLTIILVTFFLAEGEQSFLDRSHCLPHGSLEVNHVEVDVSCDSKMKFSPAGLDEGLGMWEAYTRSHKQVLHVVQGGLDIICAVDCVSRVRGHRPPACKVAYGDAHCC